MKTTKIQRTRQSSSDMNPGYSWLTRSDPSLRGVRTKFTITHNPSYAQPGEEIYINLGALGNTHPIDPSSVCLKFILTRSDPEGKLFNNLSANLVQRLIVPGW